MAYAAQSDLLTRMSIEELTQLTDDARTGQPNAVTVASDLNEASGIIEGFVRNRYQVPLQQGMEVMRICRDIAVYLLYSRRPQKMKDGIRQAYEDAMAMLKAISKGDVQLDQPLTTPTPNTATGGPVQPRCSHLRFTEHNIKGYV
jgi:phage gp36-like protein